MTSRYLLALLALLPTPASAALGRIEAVMVKTVDAEQQRTADFLARIVNQNSGTMNLAGVEAVRRMVEPEFQQLGFKTEWIDMKEAGRAGHLVARHTGNKRGKRLLLIAHLDTVFEPDSPFQRWQVEGNLAHGPGAGDDKGGIAVIIAALRAMQAAGTLKNANITVFLTGDEEDAGPPLAISRRDLIAEGKKADVALDFEDLLVVGAPARQAGAMREEMAEGDVSFAVHAEVVKDPCRAVVDSQLVLADEQQKRGGGGEGLSE